MSMRRTQVLLSEDQYQALKEEGRLTGQSISAVVRACISDHLRQRQSDPLLDMVGSISAEDDPAPDDLAERHDEYLYGGRE